MRLPLHLRRDPQPRRACGGCSSRSGWSPTSTCRRTSTPTWAVASTRRDGAHLRASSVPAAPGRSKTRPSRAPSLEENERRARPRRARPPAARGALAACRASEAYLVVRAGTLLSAAEHRRLVEDYIRRGEQPPGTPLRQRAGGGLRARSASSRRSPSSRPSRRPAATSRRRLPARPAADRAATSCCARASPRCSASPAPTSSAARPPPRATAERKRQGRGARSSASTAAGPTAWSSPPPPSAILRCSTSRCSRPRWTAPASRTRSFKFAENTAPVPGHPRAGRRLLGRRQAVGSRAMSEAPATAGARERSTRTRASCARSA